MADSTVTIFTLANGRELVYVGNERVCTRHMTLSRCLLFIKELLPQTFTDDIEVVQITEPVVDKLYHPALAPESLLQLNEDILRVKQAAKPLGMPTIKELKKSAHRARTGKWVNRKCATNFFDDNNNP